MGRIDGDDVGPGGRQIRDVLREGRDPHRAIGEVALHEADDRRIGQGAHRAQVGDPLDPQPCRAAVEGRLRHRGDDLGAVHRPAGHRLA